MKDQIVTTNCRIVPGQSTRPEHPGPEYQPWGGPGFLLIDGEGYFVQGWRLREEQPHDRGPRKAKPDKAPAPERRERPIDAG